MILFFKISNRWLTQFGIDFRVLIRSLRSLPFFVSNYIALVKKSDKNWPIEVSQPCLSDRFNSAGSLDNQYFFQDIYVAKKIYINNPINHIDIGSRIDGFIAQLSVFRKVTILDIRPLDSHIENVNFVQADICDSNFNFEKSFSVSCLHTIEHFGLGRYADPVGVDLWKVGLKNIWKIVEVGGIFYLSTPIGRQRIVYNAHRVFMPSSIINELYGARIVDFAYIDDDGNFKSMDSLEIKDLDEVSSNFSYGLGIFTILKENNE